MGAVSANAPCLCDRLTFICFLVRISPCHGLHPYAHGRGVPAVSFYSGRWS